MDIPVYKLYIGKMHLDAMLMPVEKQREMLARGAQYLADVGATNLLMADIFSDEKYQFFGVEAFPNLQAVIEHQRCLREMNWLQYMDVEVYLGTRWYPESFPINLEPYLPVDGVPAPIYKVFLWRYVPGAPELTSDENEKLEQMDAQMEELQKELGVITHIAGVATIQFNEYWTAWGLERYPNHEALEKQYQAMMKAHWWKRIEAHTYLGIATGGTLSGLA